MHYDEHRCIAHLSNLYVAVVYDLIDAEASIDEKAAVHYYTQEFLYRRSFSRFDTQPFQCKIVAQQEECIRLVDLCHNYQSNI